ncbi:MAG: DUF3137 domain-containing protein [Sphingomonadales bacterium]|nr:DUF3137 domain-containing protein [Sphingomonadales bacterium]NCQ21621.1 DUF3137 domain-containing protein [Sphingomonadales bacterium]NCT04664.1 DUF3137 domain-containing protein [Sphingomonadales bacterium]
MRNGIDGLMQGGLESWLAGQADMREGARKQAASRWAWGVALALPVLAFLWFGPVIAVELRLFASIAAGVLIAWWGYRPIDAARRAIKIGINSAIAAHFGVSYSHEAEPGAEFAAARDYGLVPGFDRSRFEDRWHGALKGHDFNLYEAHLEDQRGSGKDRRWVTVFRGPVIHMGFGRRFHSTTLLERAGKHRKWMGLGGASDHVIFKGHRLDRVDQVHPAFGDVYALYSDDQVEARVLVHPTYVEHLLRIESAFEAQELRALFARGDVIIAIEADNMFESGGMNAAADRDNAARAARQFGALAGLALAINQNERGQVLESDLPRSDDFS